MPEFMLSKMSYEVRKAETYFRKQSIPHPSHDEIGAFVDAAATDYAGRVGINVQQVERGSVRTNQGRPGHGIQI